MVGPDSARIRSDISASGRAARLKTHDWTRLRLGGPAAPLFFLLLLVTLLVVLTVVAGCTPQEGGGSATSTPGGTTATTGGTSTTSGATSTTGRTPTEARRLAPTTGTFSTCPDCHSLLDPPSVDRPALTDAFGHERHLTRGATCEDCHARPIHSESGTRRPTMAICYSCHGTAPTSIAPNDCGLCHPPGFRLQPASHNAAFYQEGHSRVVDEQGTSDCFVCHEGGQEDFCRACHGLDVPHPEGWTGGASGGPGAHTEAAHEDATICVRCHQNRGAAPAGCFGGECHGS